MKNRSHVRALIAAATSVVLDVARTGQRSVLWGTAAVVLAGLASPRSASAAPIKVAVVGGYTVHSDAYQATNREMQPPGKQEYPLLLQHMLGPSYDVRNFGDCCASVLQHYTRAETHPYIVGGIAGRGPGFPQSLAFLPDIVVMGSWGRHDWGQKTVPSEMFTVATFQADLDDLVSRYLKLPSHPKMFMSLPLPIPFGEEMPGPPYKVATKDVIPAFQAVAAKYNITLIDLYHPFLGHKELFIEEGEHIVNPAGLTIEAQETFKVLMAVLNGGAGAGDDAGPSSAGDASTGAPPADAGVAVVDAGLASATGGSGGGGSGAGGSPAGTGGASGGGAGGATPIAGTGGSGAGGAPRKSGGCSFEGANGGSGSLALCALVLGLALTRSRRRR